MRKALGVVACLFGLTISVLQAQAAGGQAVSGAIFVAAKSIPLPPGDWSVAAEYVEPVPDIRDGGLGYRHLLLVHERANAIVGVIEIRAREPTTNRQANATAARSRACAATADDPVPAVRDLGTLPVFRCRRVYFGPLPVLAETGPAALANFRASLQADRHGLPERLLQVAIGVGDLRGVVQVTYSFAPAQSGDTRDDQVAHGRAWADAVLPLVSSGFDRGAVSAAPDCR